MEHPINRYTFEFVEGDEIDARHGFPFNKEIRHEFSIPADQTWDFVLREFLAFLSNIYGYELKIEDFDADSSNNSRLSSETWS